MWSRFTKLVTPTRVLSAVCVLLLITNVITIAAWRHKAQPAVTHKYPLINIARDYIAQEHFLVNIQPLREQLNALVDKEPAGTVSVYFEFLNTGANIQINNESYFYPASLVKLPTAMATMKKVESGTWRLDNRLVLLEQDRDNRYGDLYKQPVGTSFSIEELLKALLIESDNTAQDILMRNLSEDELNTLKEDIGLEDLFNEKSEISAKEYSRIFRALYNSSFLEQKNSQRLLQWLSETKFNDMLPSGVPTGTVFAHKIGEDDVEKNYLDSGIVYLPNRPYLLTVMIKQHDQEKAQDIMKQISKATYEYVSSHGQ